jgi:hypothetical protein
MKKMFVLSLILIATATAAQEKAKPLDVSVRQVNDRRSAGFFAQLAISLDLPKIKASEVAATRVVIASATDETGLDLVDHEKTPELESTMQGIVGRNNPADTPASVSVTLKNPARKATRVKEVRGEIELYMPAKDPNSVAEIAKFLSGSGKPFPHKALKANGVEIALLSTSQVDAEKKKRAEAKKKEYAEMGFSGEDLENMLKNFMESLLGVQESELLARVKDPNGRIQEITFIDSAGEVKPVMMRDEEGLTLLSTWAKPEADWKMRVSMRTAKNVVRYTFALNDVPLP